MSWPNANDLVIGSGGEVYLGPSGTATPATIGATLNAAFVGMGYLDEDGLTVSVTPNIQEFNVWQSRQPARREALAQDVAVSGKFAQWDEDTVAVSLGKAIGSFTGTYNLAFPADTDALPEFALVADVADGTETHRFTFGRVNNTGTVEATFNRSNLAVLPFEFKVLAPAAGGSPGSYMTDSASFAAGS